MTLRWTELASEHLDALREYIARDRPTAADDVVEHVLSAVDHLERHPQLGRKGRVTGTRELVVTGTPFLVVYRVRRQDVQVLAVLHAARRWPEHF